MRLGDILKTWRIAGTRIFAELWGGLFLTNGALAGNPTTATYSASITPELSGGDPVVITATDGNAFTINAPTFASAAMSATNPVSGGLVWTLLIRNTAGGGTALGAVTLNAVFKVAAAIPAIADAKSRAFCFAWNGTNHVELWRGAADVPN